MKKKLRTGEKKKFYESRMSLKKAKKGVIRIGVNPSTGVKPKEMPVKEVEKVKARNLAIKEYLETKQLEKEIAREERAKKEEVIKFMMDVANCSRKEARQLIKLEEKKAKKKAA